MSAAVATTMKVKRHESSAYGFTSSISSQRYQSVSLANNFQLGAVTHLPHLRKHRIMRQNPATVSAFMRLLQLPTHELPTMSLNLRVLVWRALGGHSWRVCPDKKSSVISDPLFSACVSPSHYTVRVRLCGLSERYPA